MNNYFWMVVLPNISCFFDALGIVGILFCIVGGFMYINMNLDAYTQEDRDYACKFSKPIFKVLALSVSIFFIACFIPSKKDIIQLKIISVVSELKGVDQIPQKLIDRLKSLLVDEKTND